MPLAIAPISATPRQTGSYDIEAGAGDADLSAVDEIAWAAPCAALCTSASSRMMTGDFAAQFQCEPGHVADGRRPDQLADLGRSGEGDLVDAGWADNAAPAVWP